MQTWNLTGRVAVVNQAAAENGPAICESLRQMGATVIEVGGTQINHLEGLVAQAVQAYGRVDIMVNNTQLYPAQPAKDLPANIFRHQVSANVDSVFFGCQIAGRHMLAQQPLQSQPFPLRGVIINIASVAGVVAIQPAHPVGAGGQTGRGGQCGRFSGFTAGRVCYRPGLVRGWRLDGARHIIGE